LNYTRRAVVMMVVLRPVSATEPIMP